MMVGLLQLPHLRPVFAETDGYTWAGAQCVDGTNCSTTYNWGYSLPCPSIDPHCLSYPYPNGTNPTAGIDDTWGYGVRNCTSYVAWKINQVFGKNISGWGDAKNWADSTHGYTVDNTPSKDAIAVWQTGGGGHGHVAYVYAVNTVNGVKVASLDEYNSGYPLNYNNNPPTLQWGLFYSGRTTASNSAGTPYRYIHIGTPSGGIGYSRLAALQYNTEIDVFKRGGDNAIWKDTWQPANNAWSGWNSLGGVLASDPVAIKYNTEMDVFAIASNGQVVKDTWNGSSWSNWNSLGGTMVGTPSAVQDGSSEMDVYARGTNNQIYKDTWNGSTWSGWNSLGGSIAGNPKAMIYGGSEMDVWARGTDGALWKDGWNGSSWGGFSSMGSSIVGDPAAIQYNSEMDVYANTPSGELFKRTWNGSSWSSWIGMPGVTFSGSPAALQYNTEMDVYARGANDSYIYKNTWQPSNNTRSGWTSLGGNEAGDPTAIQYSTEMDVYATNYAKNTDKDTWLPANNNWSGFTALL
jgi:surface antigen